MRATCDVCHMPVSAEFLQQIVEENEGKGSDEVEFVAITSATSSSVIPTRRISQGGCGMAAPRNLREMRDNQHNGIEGLAWMAEDKKWVEIKIWEYESAVERTKKEFALGGPVRKRGQFRYTFWSISGTGKRKKRTLETDYFSEDDDSIVISGINDDNQQSQRRRIRRVSAPK